MVNGIQITKFKSQITNQLHFPHRPAHAVEQNRNRHGHAERNFCGLRIVERYLGPRHPQLNNAASKCAMFRSVCFSRPFQMTTASAMTPATRIVPISTESNCRQPRQAPKAPASFQSPAPRLRTITKGSSSPRPNAVPSNAAFSPGQRYRIVLTATPAPLPTP